jgi:hypothetical protein
MKTKTKLAWTRRDGVWTADCGRAVFAVSACGATWWVDVTFTLKYKRERPTVGIGRLFHTAAEARKFVDSLCAELMNL